MKLFINIAKTMYIIVRIASGITFQSESTELIIDHCSNEPDISKLITKSYQQVYSTNGRNTVTTVSSFDTQYFTLKKIIFKIFLKFICFIITLLRFRLLSLIQSEIHSVALSPEHQYFS